MKKNIKSASLPIDEDNRQWCIDLKPGELADNIVLVGDPARVHTLSKMLDSTRLQRQNREFLTVTGTYKSIPVSILSTGIGQSSTEIAILEALQITNKPNFIRVGTCGGIQQDVRPGDLVISTASVRLEEVSTLYVPPGYPAVANYEIVNALIKHSQAQNACIHVGFTASTSSFYAGQGRVLADTKGLPNSCIDIDDLRNLGILNVEMESSIIFTLASLNQCKAGCICVVMGNRIDDSVIQNEQLSTLEEKAATIALEALVDLNNT